MKKPKNFNLKKIDLDLDLQNEIEKYKIVGFIPHKNVCCPTEWLF